mmetsp:Transcript_27828/g.83118  ORF Transcript_27828/g.83118 Transcript_27828/m.83118 type:complete len:224 (+) Transcript_27828:897-1568(+)
MLDALHHGGKVVVQDNEVGGLLAHLGAAAHGQAAVCLLQRRRVIHAITRDPDALALGLEQLDDLELLLRRCAREDGLAVLADGVPVLLLEALQLGAGEDDGAGAGRAARAGGEAAGAVHILRADDAHLLRDRFGSRWVVPRDHRNPHLRGMALRDGLPDPRAGRVAQGHPAEEGEARHGEVWLVHVKGKVAPKVGGGEPELAEAEDPLSLGGGLLNGVQDGRA